ncbi:hypothetical protein GCK72_004751 [Caenorhabditis remanei]|uniref:Transcription factor Dp-1 n=1 Tax=Caenorhabditis remanei TaxID=31234 RepID=A0A6A5HD08_CAERE|nr:hypothetical protein GCK72_004751 [Caenorhabditis remanei]KAF1764801.1 hypothetical protein GCK72_004751 [Caenorhabditis remanei]
MNPTYDQRHMQLSQNRPQTSGSTKRYVQMPTGMPRQPLYPADDHFNDTQSAWDEPSSNVGGGGGGGVVSSQQNDKPTGLRHFSTKVCEKVKEKGLTNYNEVADELVSDYFQNNLMKQIDVVKQEYDMKNIRRRVYDALNVLLAMNIITKNKKDIRWIGLPASASQEISRLEEEKARREASIKSKRETLKEMILQIVSYKNLVAKNREAQRKNGEPSVDTILHLPFLMIHTHKDTNVECSVSADKSEFLFSFDRKFKIHDDFEVLKKLNLTCSLNTSNPTDEEVKIAKSYLPSLHQNYVDEIISNNKKQEIEREENKKRLLAQQHSQLQLQYYEQDDSEMSQVPNPGRYNRQLQEHLMNDGSEDRSAADGIMEREDEMEKSVHQGNTAIRVGPLYSNYSPQKLLRQQANSSNTPLQAPQPTRRYYVQKNPTPQMRREMSPAIRTVARPYPAGGARMVAGGSVTGGVKYYVPGQGPSTSLHPAPRYGQSSSSTQQRVVYSSGSGIPTQLAPGQRIVTQRIVTPGGPHPPGTIVRKVIRKIVVNSGTNQAGGVKQSAAQQVIQKKMMEQEMIERKPEQPMTSAQAAALIQHPPPAEYDYFE